MLLHRIDYNGGDIWVDKEADCWYDSLPIGTKYLHKEDDYVGISEMTKDTILGSLMDSEGNCEKIYFHIVAQSANLSLPNIPYVGIEDDVDDIIGMSDALETIHTGYRNCDFESGFEHGWKERGYKAVSAKKYTEEDVRQLMYWTAKMTKGKLDSGLTEADVTISIEEKIQSLQPKIESIEADIVDGKVIVNKINYINK